MYSLELIWEKNHYNIMIAIKRCIDEFCVLPTKVYLQNATGLSRKTIYKHLATLKNNDAHQQRTEMFNILTDQVLSKVVHAAISGDLGAAKVYLQTMAKQNITYNKEVVVINNQHNYVQVNNTIISQQAIKQLGPEQKQIEEIITKRLNP